MIETGKDKSRIVKSLEFGDGDIFSMDFNNGKSVGICFYQGVPGEVGRPINIPGGKDALDIFKNKAEVYMNFKNIESLDVTINNLKSIRKIFTDRLEDNK